MARSEEQAARNEVAFREANERIAERSGELTAVEGPTPFLCECEDEDCTEIVRLSLDEYRRVRAEATQFVVALGHPTRGEPTPLAGAGWVCVHKDGIDGIEGA
ncbi:MAG TPA: hypothetical protein VFL66_08455 [Gaiellaceae bacterium]|nr:hypothetical protein [Gaiellaceae bacterium]